MIPPSSCPTPLREEDLPSFEELQNSEEVSESESTKPNEAGLFTQNDIAENLDLSQKHEANVRESGESTNVKSNALTSVRAENDKLNSKSETVSKHVTIDAETKKLQNLDNVEGNERESLTSLSLATVDFDGEVMSNMIYSLRRLSKKYATKNARIIRIVKIN